MTRTRSIISLPAVVMALLLGVVIGYQALAQRAVAPAAPVVASVRIDELFEGLRQRAEAKIEIDSMQREIEAENQRRQEELARLEQELEDAVAEATQRELTDRIALKQLQTKFWQQEAVTMLEVEKALQLQNLYKEIRRAIDALAAAEGYDMVIIDDQSDELPYDREAQVPPQVQILQQIANRDVLYLNPALDITGDLIERMNNAYRQGP
jgi:Skp family chaperone for outer membrane proteins